MTTTSFNSLDDAVSYAEALLGQGYARRGNWSLGQVCDHLVKLMAFTQGVSRIPLGGLAQSITVAAFFRLLFLGRVGQAIGLRIPTFRRPSRAHPMPDDQGVRELRRAIERQKTLDSAAASRLHVWHAGHHLGFLAAETQPAIPGRDAMGVETS